MTRVILSAELRSMLFDLSRPLDLCDETGRVLGTFLPSPGLPRRDYDEPPLTEEEWRRREQEPDYSTDEVIARLEKL